MKAHITNLGLENFRVFKDKTDFEFAPITILTGTNNSGKSSLINALELLHENIKPVKNSEPSLFDKIKKIVGSDSNSLSKSIGISSLGKPFQIGSFSERYSDISSFLARGETKNFIFSTKIRGYRTAEIFNCRYTYLIDNGTNPKLHLEKVEMINRNNEVIFSYGEIVQINYNYFFSLFKDTFNHSKECWRNVEAKINLYNSDNSLNAESRKKIKEELNEKHALNLDDKFFYMLIENGDKIELRHMYGLPGSDEWNSPIFDSVDDYKNILSKYDLKTFHDKQEFSKISKEEPLINTFIDDVLGGSDWSNFSEAYFKLLSKIEYNPIYKLMQNYQGALVRSVSKNSIFETPIQKVQYKLSKQVLSDLPLICSLEIIKNESLFELNEISQTIKLPMSTLEEWFYEDFLANNLTAISRAIRNFSTIEVRDATAPPRRVLLSQNDNDWMSKFVNTFYNESETLQKEMLDYINRWIVNFGIGKALSIQKIEGTRGYQIFLIKNNNESFNLTEVGYGVTMILRVITHAFNESPKDEMWDALYDGLSAPRVCVIEEPESNLHPALQSKLADMFIDAARTFNTQFIIETHSEYLIRKLQYLTAKGEIKPEDTAIYYFYPPDDGPPGEDQVKRIDIQEDGSLTDDFGTGFFDEADNLAIDLYTLLTQNRKN